jgi:nucleotide-binding universal stress UspA family protein
MFSKVLIATDSSPAAHAVVRCGEALHRLGALECILAQCFMIREHVAFPGQIREHIESALNEQKRMLEKQGLRTTVMVEAGLPGRGIPGIAEREDCSLIVAGSQGRNFAGEAFLGGTVGAIIHQATKPVLIVRVAFDEVANRIECSGGSCSFARHVLYPTDFSKHAEYAFAYVRELVERGARRVTLLHVQDRSMLGRHLHSRLNEFNRTDRKRLEALRDQLADAGDAEIEIQISYGSPTEEILKCSSMDGASVVVMGSHGRGFIAESFLGSVSHNVARHSRVPVLLIPAQRKE